LTWTHPWGTKSFLGIPHPRGGPSSGRGPFSGRKLIPEAPDPSRASFIPWAGTSPWAGTFSLMWIHPWGTNSFPRILYPLGKDLLLDIDPSLGHQVLPGHPSSLGRDHPLGVDTSLRLQVLPGHLASPGHGPSLGQGPSP